MAKRGVRERALDLLSRREHGRRELSMKLTRRGLDRDEVEAALDQLEERGWLDDRRAANTLASYQARVRRQGPRKIRAKLIQQHRLSPRLVDEALGALEGEHDWLESARDVARGRRIRSEDPKAVERIARYLAGRGFGGDIAWQVARERVAQAEE